MQTPTDPNYPLVGSSTYGGRGNLIDLLLRNGIEINKKITKPNIQTDPDTSQTRNYLKDELHELEQQNKILPSMARCNRITQINHLLNKKNIEILTEYNVLKSINRFANLFSAKSSYFFEIIHDQSAQKISIKYRSADHEPIRCSGIFSIFFKKYWINHNSHIKK